MHELKHIQTYFELQLPVQSVPITTEVASSNSAYSEVYSIQQYVIIFVSDLRQFGEETNKTDHHDITEILLKVTSNIIILIHTDSLYHLQYSILHYFRNSSTHSSSRLYSISGDNILKVDEVDLTEASPSLDLLLQVQRLIVSHIYPHEDSAATEKGKY